MGTQKGYNISTTLTVIYSSQQRISLGLYTTCSSMYFPTDVVCCCTYSCRHYKGFVSVVVILDDDDDEVDD